MLRKLNLYGKATASLITVRNDRQPSKGDRPGVGTGACKYNRGKQGRRGRGSRKDAQSSSSYTDDRVAKGPVHLDRAMWMVVRKGVQFTLTCGPMIIIG